MKEFATLRALKQAFVTGEFHLDEEVKVNGVVYHNNHTSNKETVLRMIQENAKSVVVYSNSDEESKWLMFLWGAHKNTVVPYDVRTTTNPILEAQQDISDRIIPDKVEVHFLNLPVNGSLIAKVDTGAEMCSLHAQDVKINRDERTVSFVAPQLSRNTIKMNLSDQQAVKTSGGDTAYRAVITATIKIKGKVLKDILINLNDRSEMSEPMLVGQNALEPGKFLIDPNLIKEAGELLTTEFLTTLQQDKVIPLITLTDETTQKLYEALNEVGDISVGDLIKLLRTQVLKNLNDIAY